jgi:hypothetical protein
MAIARNFGHGRRQSENVDATVRRTRRRTGSRRSPTKQTKARAGRKSAQSGLVTRRPTAQPRFSPDPSNPVPPLVAMRKTRLLSLTLAGLCACAQIAAGAVDKIITLRSFGAVGDGKTDDRAAIQKALNSARGERVDGEGLAYAVHGNIDVSTDVDFRHATLLQTMGPPDTRKYFREQGTYSVQPAEAMNRMVKGYPVMRPDGQGTYAGAVQPTADELPALSAAIILRTLAIRGAEGKPVKVRLEKIRIDRGRHPDSGGRSDGAGIHLQHVSPAHLSDLVITGDGKGMGINLARCSNVKIERAHIHDMTWAPYAGDAILEKLSAREIRDDFGWNVFPIYEFRSAQKRFVRVRVQEQLVGIFVGQCKDVEIRDSRIEGLQVKIGGQMYPLQSDAITIGNTQGVVVRNTDMAKAWEGIDFTGQSGRDFLFENCTVTDTIGWAFKLAHPKQNGKIVDCLAIRGGIAGFLVGAQSENVELIRCRAIETAANGYWKHSDGHHIMAMSGFRIQGEPNLATPRGIHLRDCLAVNQLAPGAIDYGILCEAPADKQDITLNGFTSVGAKLADLKGIKLGGATSRVAKTTP